ncbi:phosphatases II [Neocallimastix lanati (nom. inval.)]|uniref:Phosphatases II n=1 Tax=Neocallimastix californiae TaxID=1754190 RepID=A0A1Y2F368_9FUNG|nr:phosphatases II [Neocallimastix sp. JGI-2020a]ORY77924.1 phosphatases II [Neocallimastix californiae]|eukprot:ORY77924.1 phosphatases II [Neocallimastix californiae]
MEIEQYDSNLNIWKYEMRREMQEIIPGLFLGPFYCAKNLKLLQDNKITHILCINDVKEEKIVKPYFKGQFIYLIINASDNPLEILIPNFTKVKNFINNALYTKGKILIHSNVGISRSPAFVIAYLMETKNISYNEAFKLVKSKRFCIKPNMGFELQLKEYEPIFKAKNSTENSSETTYKKNRKRDSDDDNNVDDEDDD